MDSTGSEEVGAIGMANFIESYQEEFEKDTTYFINIDNVGNGKLHYYLGEGMLNFYSFSEKLISAAKKTTTKKEFNDVTPKNYRVAYTDAIIPASKGYHAILLLATDERDVIPNWHWETDNMDNLDFDLIDKTSDFAFKLIEKLYEDVTKKTKDEYERKN